MGLQAEEALVVVDWYGYSYLVDGGAAGVQLAVQGVRDDGGVVMPRMTVPSSVTYETPMKVVGRI